MKKLSLLIMSIMLFVCSSFLCSCSNNDNLNCYFDNNNEILLILGTDKDCADLNIIVENGNRKPDLTWNKEIIDYDVNNGKVVAKEIGQTSITMNYYSSNEFKSNDINVVVEQACFATEIIINKEYIFKLNEDYGCELNPTIIARNGDYNLDIIYESSDNSIIEMLNNKLVPKSVGEVAITIKVKSSYDNVTNTYTYVKGTTTIKVEPISEISVCLNDDNFEELQYLQGYNLFYGKSKDTFYYIKLQYNEALMGYSFDNLIIKSENCVLCTNKEILYMDNICYIPVKAIKSGIEKVIIQVTDNSAYNYKPIVTNSTTIKSVKYATDIPYIIGTVTANNIEDDFMNITSNDFVDLEQEEGYVLYAIGGSEDNKICGHNAQKYFYSLILFDNYDTDCYNTFTIIYNSNKLELVKLSNNLFYVEAIEVGNCQVAIKDDGCDNCVVIDFNVKEIKVEKFEFYSNTNIELVIDENDRVDLAMVSVTPSYATYDYFVEIKDATEVVKLSEDGHTIIANKSGNSVVTVTFNDEIRTYCINVRMASNQFILNNEVNEFNLLSLSDYIIFNYSIKDVYNNVVVTQTIDYEVIEGNVDIIVVRILNNQIEIYGKDGCKGQCVIKFIATNNNFYAESKEITINCDLTD